MKSPCHNQFALVGVLLFCLLANSLRANVYATDIKVNGCFQTALLLPGGSNTISYILNDTATGGVSIQIYAGTNVVKTLSSTNGNAGTNAGLNTAVWDGSTDNGTNLAEGAYSVSITAASAGYPTWTNITDDGSNYSVFLPRGISVNQNSNSPYYGRVYVGNALAGGDDQPGIFKYNADGSPADEGGFSTGGYGWAGDKYSPWKMAIGADNRVYVDDFYDTGLVFSFDATIGSNSLLPVIRTDNYPTNDDAMPYLSSLSIIGSDTNTQIWMADENAATSAGIIGWQIGTNGVAASNDMGTVIVPVNSYLTQAPYDFTLDSNGFIYTTQFITNGNPAYDLLSFPPYQGVPETMAYRAISMFPFLLRASGLAADPTASLVAIGDTGECDTESPCGGLYLFSTPDLAIITNLDQTGGDPYYDVAWDNVGNLYALDGLVSNAVWRVYSPPGTNQATTVAVPIIQAYNALLPANLCNPAVCQCGMGFELQGQSNITYLIQWSPDLTNWFAAATNYSILTNQWVCVPIAGDVNFYRAVTLP